jgi:cation diffusion facilitator CzcD-associated flavoprotein CzcO
MAGGAEILKYIQGTAKKFDLEKCMRFNTKVLEATWNENEGKWNLASKMIYLTLKLCLLILVS